jgi:hypothetical protein
MNTSRVAKGLLAGLALGGVGLTGCQGKTPASVELALPQLVAFSSGTVVPIQAWVKNKSGELLKEVTPVFSLAPPDVAVVTQDGTLRCLKSGRVTVQAAAGQAVARSTFECNLVDRVLAPAQLRIEVGQREPNPGSAVNAEGQLTIGVSVQMASSDTKVVRPQDNQLVGVDVGSAVVTFTAEDKSATTELSVTQRLENVPLQIRDGEIKNHLLGAGNYEVEVEVTGDELDLKWVGGEPESGCYPSEQGLVHRLSCRLPQGGTLILNNDSELFGGDVAVGVLRAIRVP